MPLCVCLWNCFWWRFTNSPNESTWDYALGVFIGLNVMGLVSGIISSSRVILSHPNFVRKVVFPLEILPAALVGALVFDLLIGFCLSYWVLPLRVRG